MDWFGLFLKQGNEVIRFVSEKFFVLSTQEELRLDETGNRENSWAMAIIQARSHAAPRSGQSGGTGEDRTHTNQSKEVTQQDISVRWVYGRGRPLQACE